MRSSPNFLVVSRKDLSNEGWVGHESEDSEADPSHVRPSSFQVDENEGLTFYLKVDYKVVLIVVVILDLVHFSLNEIVARIISVK
jgi:hypothetical protein